MKQNIPNTKRRATAFISVLYAVLACGLAGCAPEQSRQEAQTPAEAQKTEVVCVYYPHWHVYPEGEKWFGKNWTEWEFVKTAIPRFKGHKQPMKPLMGYLDGKSPDDLAKEIELASNSGIDVFLYDWYFYGDGIQTMSESLEQGFLKAPNSGKMKFAIMWCYHDRRNAFRPEYGKPRQMLQPLSRTPQEFLNAVEYCAKNYFTKPNYWHVDGKPYFSIFAAAQFMSDMGGAEKTRELLKKADAVSVKYCGKPVHWSGMVFGRKNFDDYAAAQFDSLSNYNVNPSAIPDFGKYAAKRQWVFEYSQMADAHRLTWNFYANAPMKFIPVATSGWDSSPRCRADVEFPWKKAEYPYGTIATNTTGDKFEALLRDAKAFTEKSQKSPRAVLINGWNEYTEGSFLIPTLRDGDSMLRAVAAVFGRRPADKYVFGDMATRKLCSAPAATFENLSYGTHAKNKLDVWLPKNATSKTPAVIYFHGGGWTSGSTVDAAISAQIPALLSRGVAVVCADYRFIQDAVDADIFPPVSAPLADAVSAVDFVKANAAKWNIDASKIGLAGGSAGACSALYAALSGKADVAFVAASVPQTSLDPAQMRSWIPEIEYGASAFGFADFDAWLKNRASVEKYISQYSPAALVPSAAARKTKTEFFLFYPNGKLDATHSEKFGENFEKICKSNGVSCKVVRGELDISSCLK